MKAAAHTIYGPPEVTSIREVAKPVIRPDEILIRVRATTVNRTDCGFRSAQYFISRFFSGLFRPKNGILGCEFAGEVVEIGAAVAGFRVGDRVFGYDDNAFGGHAEFKAMTAKGAIALIPDGMDYMVAAALTEGSHYALCNIRSAKIKAGDMAMAYGASGAIGSAAVQLLKYFGAYVVAVVGTQHVELARSLGADEVIDYMTQDFTETQHRFDFIFDAVGKRSFAQCRPLLKPRGVYISTELGKRSENIFLALTTPLWKGKKVLFPLPVIRKEDISLIKELAETGQLRPVIDREYPLEDIVEAYRYVETGQKVGNVVIRVGE